MKKAITLLVALVSIFAASLSLAAPPSAQMLEDRAAAIGSLMQDWQAKILAYNLPVDDAKNWSRRNMAKFSRLNSERLALAQRAGTLAELELVLMEAPVGDGSRLDVLMANKRGDITMLSSGAKSSPATTPAAYAGMVFTALSPCRILDSRPSQGGTGAWFAGSTNLIKIGPYSTAGGGYATGAGAQGGSATSCGLDTLAGPGQVAMIMAAVSTVSQVGAGYLTFFSNGAPNPGLTSVSQWFQPGYVQTSFVVIPSDLIGTVAAQGFTSNGTDVIIDVVGYFAAEVNDGVTSITAGTGLTGGTITTTGTVAIATGYQLPQACTNGQHAQSNGAGSWSCVTPASGGTVTGVTASAPLASSGGTAPNISLSGGIPVANGGTGQTTLSTNGIVYGQGTSGVATAVGTTGQVLAGTAGAPAWTGDPSLSGSLYLATSTPTTGNIMKGGVLFIHNSGSQNTFIGANAGNLGNTGGANTASGMDALTNITTGFGNTAIGVRSLLSNTTGTFNTASGIDALHSSSSGVANTATGANALYSNTAGSQNTATGNATLFQNTIGAFNTANGESSLKNNTSGNENTASGWNALFSNTTGGFNTANGASALQNNTTGNINTASGLNALLSNTTGSENTAGGANALQQNTTGVQNTATGVSALQNNTTGTWNTATGYSSLAANTTGIYNVATGLNALLNNTNGAQNVAVGVSALNVNVSGSSNTAVGNIALLNSTGSNNVALGIGAGINLTSGNFNIDIGNAGAAAEGNTTRIGDGNQNRTFISGIRGVTTGVANGVTVLIDSNGQLGTVSSSRRFKDDIADMDAASSALMQLRPVTFHYKTDRGTSGRTLQYGLIAEEVAEVYPGLVAHSADGQVETVMYQYLPAMLLNEFQKQQRTIAAQTTHIAELERERQTLRAAVAEIADLKRQTAYLARLLDQQRTGTVTAGLELK